MKVELGGERLLSAFLPRPTSTRSDAARRALLVGVIIREPISRIGSSPKGYLVAIEPI